MKIRILIIVAIIIIFNISCDDDTNNNSIAIETGLRLSYINSENDDLLDTVNNLAYSDIKVYQLNGDLKKNITYIFAPSSITKLPYCYIGFNIDSKDAYYIKLNETDIDTVFGVIENIEHSEFLEKIIYNNVDKTLEDSTGVYKIVK